MTIKEKINYIKRLYDNLQDIKIIDTIKTRCNETMIYYKANNTDKPFEVTKTYTILITK